MTGVETSGTAQGDASTSAAAAPINQETAPAEESHVDNDLADVFESIAATAGEATSSQQAEKPIVNADASGSIGNGLPSAGAKAKRPKKAERELNEALLFLAAAGEHEAAVPAVAPAEATQEPAKAPKPRKKAQKKTADSEPAPAEQVLELEPEPVVPVVAPRRKLKMEQTWFDPDELPTAVPYPIRYYLSQPAGQPIVSWREPEASDAQSNLPEGTLFENGARVNPTGKVDAPEDRRANTACEFCKYR